MRSRRKRKGPSTLLNIHQTTLGVNSIFEDGEMTTVQSICPSKIFFHRSMNQQELILVTKISPPRFASFRQGSLLSFAPSSLECHPSHRCSSSGHCHPLDRWSSSECSYNASCRSTDSCTRTTRESESERCSIAFLPPSEWKCNSHLTQSLHRRAAEDSIPSSSNTFLLKSLSIVIALISDEKFDRRFVL